VSNGIKDIYEKIFDNVFPQVKDIQRGLLYKTIQILLREEESKEQEKTREICDQLQIKPNSRREDDYKVIANLIETVYIDRQAFAGFIHGKDIISELAIKFNTNVGVNEEEKMKWIIITACVLVGVGVSIQYLRETDRMRQEKANKKRERRAEQSKPTPPPPLPASLCLIVPASVVSSLRLEENSKITVEMLSYLIDNASYFIGSTIEYANSNEQHLEASPAQNIIADSKQDTYIRIEVDNGRNLIGTRIRYKLKENLLPDANYIVRKIAVLRNLSGLEKFNRI
jgi:hypothetical protein